MQLFDTFFFVTFSTIFTIVNPLGALGPFLAMTGDHSATKRKHTAQRAAMVCAGVLIAFTLLGAVIFRFFGITIPALKIAGGILLFLVSVDMLNARASRIKSTQEEADEGSGRADIAVFPLAIPLLSGPGAIVSALILSEQAHSMVQHLVICSAIALTSAAAYLILREAHHIAGFLGQIGLNVMSRLMGLILASVATQFVIDGVKSALPNLQ